MKKTTERPILVNLKPSENLKSSEKKKGYHVQLNKDNNDAAF